MIVDGKDLILGRMNTFIAKKLLLGETINVVNCEQVLISGDKKKVLALYKKNYDRMTHATGPFIPKTADRFVKRSIRGMLPYKTAHGLDAYKRLRCYVSVPDSLKDQKFETFKVAHVSKLPNLKYISVKEICRFIGGKQ